MEPESSVRMVSSDVNVNNNSTTTASSFVSAHNSPHDTTSSSNNTMALANRGDNHKGAVAVAVAAGRNDHRNIDIHVDDDDDDANATEAEDAGVIAAPPAATLNTSSFQSSGGPAEIPPEPSSEGGLGDDDEEEEEQGQGNGDHDNNSLAGADNHNVEVDDDDDDAEDEESEYEYEDEDDAAFSGFLVDHPTLAAAQMLDSHHQQQQTGASGGKTGSAESPARIRDEEESVTNHTGGGAAAASASLATDAVSGAAAVGVGGDNRKPKWREPSRAAVSMSLRAEREKTGSKRRLAQDLYRIMNQDTEEAGFSIAPKSEDNMDHWIIKLFMFDPDSNLAKDMVVLGFEHIELEMTFPDQYPFEPPFVRVVRPRFKRQTGFVMNGALCMELLTKDGWNPVNDIESVIVSIRSLLVVGDGRLQAAFDMAESKYQARLKACKKSADEDTSRKRQKKDDESPSTSNSTPNDDGGSYSIAEAHAAYSHLSDYHKKKGWDSSGWWARKG